MRRHLLYVGLVTVLALGCMFYPFMPGGYDPFAVALSMMAQTLGFVGLLLVPIGALWLRSELTTQRSTSGSQPTGGRWLRYAALLASAVVGLAVALAATMTSGALAVAVLAVWVSVTSRVARAARSDRRSAARLNPTPLYLTVVPCVLVVARLAFMQGAVHSSRDRTMLGSETFIRAIEAYRQVHGHYPISLESVHHDYDPSVVGVERYRYERRGDSYNVLFEQFSDRLGTREFVMFNPRDDHDMIVHNQDELESSPEQVRQERRFHAASARPAGRPHWKYFWFD